MRSAGAATEGEGRPEALPAADICSRAFLARDRRFDGRLFIGVRTTGVYCRPICPVRPPKVENVRFFPSAAAAAAAGFRPCLRCRPEASPGTPAWVGTSATVTRGLRLIADGALDDGSVEELAARLGVGSRHLRRLFLRHLGASPSAVAKTRRLHFAKKLLDETDLSMADVAFAAGFGSIRRFNATFREVFDRSPGALRRGRRSGGGVQPFSLRVAFRPPFDWPRLLRFLAARAIPGVEQVEAKRYRRSFAIGGEQGRIEVVACANREALEIRVDISDPRPLGQLVERARSLFDLDADPSCISAHLGADRRLRRYLPAEGVRVPGAWDGFETAVRAVLGQQITVQGATTLAGRLVERYGTPLASPAPAAARGEPTRLFPAAEDLVDEDLAVIGMPRSRAETLRGLARAVVAGAVVLDPGADPIAMRQALLRIRGIGPWTAEYVAMRALRQPDALPASDLGLRRGLANGDGLPSPRQVEEMAEAWRPWRAYGVMAIWQGEASPAAGRKRRD